MSQKFIVVCYALHDMCVASVDAFTTEQDASTFMMQDAQHVYEEECGEENDADIQDYGDSIYVSSCDKEYEWTWSLHAVV